MYWDGYWEGCYSDSWISTKVMTSSKNLISLTASGVLMCQQNDEKIKKKQTNISLLIHRSLVPSSRNRPTSCEQAQVRTTHQHQAGLCLTTQGHRHGQCWCPHSTAHPNPLHWQPCGKLSACTVRWGKAFCWLPTPSKAYLPLHLWYWKESLTGA